jgi:hypothetical protein
MSNQFLKLRRSAVPGRIPTTSSLDLGEIALNTYDGLAFMKKSGSSGEEIVTLGTGTGGGGNITGSQYFLPIFNSTSSLITSSIYQSGSFTSIRGITPIDPTNPDILFISGSGIETYNLISAHSDLDDFIQINIQNYNIGGNASSDIVATKDDGTDNYGYINMGINGSQYSNNAYVGNASDAYLYSLSNGNLLIGNAETGREVIIFNGGLDAGANSKIHIHDQGTVGINTSTYNITNPPSLQIAPANSTTYNLIQAKGDTDSYLQIAITNANAGVSASADMVAYNNIDPENQLAGFIDIGINSTTYAPNAIYPGGNGDSYIFSDAQNLLIGNVSGSRDVVNIFAGGANADTNSKLKLRASNIHSLTGSLQVTGSITSSLFGTSSWAVSASWAPSQTIDTSRIVTGSVTASVNVNQNSFSVVSSSISLLTSYNNGALNHGNNSTASGIWSHAEGSATQAVGSYSHAEGDGAHAGGSNSAYYASSIVNGVATLSSSYGDVTEYFDGGKLVIYNPGTTALQVYSIDFAEYNAPSTEVFLIDATINISGPLYVGSTDYINEWTGNQVIPVGNYSHAEGEGAITLGQSSHAGGASTIALGAYSHAKGSSTLASGFSSHAEGQGTIASGLYSHAEGQGTIASGNNSHAEGSATLASESGAHAEGYITVASGSYSHAEGANTQALGSYSHAEGNESLAIGTDSHAEGQNTQAIGAASHAEGFNTKAIGGYSHAEGRNTYTGLPYAFSASMSNGTVTFNSSYGDKSLQFTNGDVLVIYEVGSDTVEFSTITNSSFNGTNTVVALIDAYDYPNAYVGNRNQNVWLWDGDQEIPGVYSHAEGRQTYSPGESSKSSGHLTTAYGFTSHAEGYSVKAIGEYSHAEGETTQAIGYASHAEGLGTVTSGSYQHVQGQYNISSSDQSAFIIGNGIDEANRSNLVFASGSLFQITGSLGVTGGITGSLFGTASWARNALTSSTATSSSFAINSTSASFATTASYVLNAVSASYAATASVATSASFTSTASFAVSASQAQTSSYVLNAVSSSFTTTASYVLNAVSASFASTASSADNFLVRGTLTAQTIVVQTITSSIEYVTGSTQFGSLLSNTHQFTGSVSITGSLSVNGSNAVLSNQTGSMSVATASFASTASYWSGSILNATSASFASTASYVVTALTASYITASNVIGTVASASFATTASYVLNAISASFASTASYVLNAVSASFATTASYILNAVSASFSSTASYVLNAVSSSFASTASYVLNAVSSSFAATASYANSPFDIGIAEFNSTSSTTTAGTTAISSIATGSFTSAFYNYTISSGSNARAGQVMSVWSGGTVRYTEVTTTDIGNTAIASFAVALSGANVRLNFTAPGVWTVKSIANLL